ncbi:MAG: Amino acid adenylation protein, partial [Acidobacteriota bacterium]|nr:Amino acid adenylation protein [Acidobacteriota bacterium]
ARLFKSFAKYPGHTAIECENHTITYRELDQYSNEIAHWLKNQGIAKETFIGVAIDDKIALIAIILGIIKAGCVFVPLDNHYPDKRIGAMLASAETPNVFTGEALLEKYKSIRRQLEHRLDIFTVNESFFGPGQCFRLQRHEDKYKLSEAEKTRYKRQILIDGWGLVGQERLKASTVFVAGAGGSGSPLIQQLALCGFGTIIICDYDTVELSNLNRQSLHDELRIGMNKALSAQMTVERLNPHVNVIPRQEKITMDNVFDLVGEAEIIFDNVDSLETKSCLSQCAVAKGIPHIISSMIHINSYACIFHTPYTPCFHCLYDKKKIDDIGKAKTLDSQYEVIPNSVASPALFLSTGFAVNEAVKILMGFGKPAYNKYMHFNQYGSPDVVNTTGYKQITYPFNDHFRQLSRKQGFDWDTGWHGRFLEEIAIEPDPQCPICSSRPQWPQRRWEPINAVEPFPRSNSFPGSGDLSTPILEYFPEDKINIYFTSGTTGQPKAVLGKNEGMAHFIAWEIKEFNIDETKRVSQLTSQCHDPFLRDIFTPLCAGATICVPDSRETILDTAKMIRWLEQSKVNLVHCTPGLFKVFGSNGINPESFPHLQYVLLAGEKIAPRDLENWYNAIGERVQLVNIYGPTETTLAKLFYRIRPEDIQRDVIPIGNPIPGAKVIILNKELKICGPGEVGEIYIRTPFRSYGYYKDPTLNSEKFIKNPFGDSPGDIIYKTGDLGKWNREGHIEFVGREDRQVKIRGFRVELDEIEKRLWEYPGIREAVVLFRVTGTGNQIICAYFRGDISVPELKEYLGRELPDYMAPSFYIKMETFPLNINGKIDYKALPGLDAVEREKFAAPRNEMEKRMAGIWTEVLGIERIGIKDGFLDMGGNSLNAMSLTARTFKEFNVNLQLSVIFANPTVEGLVSIINASVTNIYQSIEPVEEREYYPLSSAQMRMYLLREFAGEGDISYNQPKVLLLRGKIDINRMEGAFRRLIERHDALRTCFKNINGPVSIINQKFLQGAAPPAYCTAPVFSFSESIISKPYRESQHGTCRRQKEIDEVIKSFIKPFDLSRAPLFRVGLVEIAEEEHILIFDIHHIISDGVTTGIFIDEFMKLYNGEPLPDLLIQYKDYAVWQQEMVQLGPFKKQENYWLEVFKEEPPVLNLSTDYPRPAAQSYEGAHWSFTIEDRLIQRLEQMARERGATLYMALLSAYNALLYRYTGQEDIVVGSPVANRPHADLQRIPGVFINTLAMRNRPRGEQTFEQLLAAVTENAFKAYENQDYPFEELVGQLELRRDLQRNPLFETLFIMQNIDQMPIRLEGLEIEPYPFDAPSSKFDISMIVLETSAGYSFSFEYCTRLFRRETVERFSRHFVALLEAAAKEPQLTIARIDILSMEEKEQLILEFNDTNGEYPDDKTIHGLFEEQVKRTPDHIAVLGQTARVVGHVRPVGLVGLSYNEINKQSDQLAQLLIEKGVLADNIVGIMMERSVEMIIGILGILKSGCAYLPIDPVYPQERIQYMLADSGARLLVNEKFFRGCRGAVFQKSPPVFVNLAYIIYTSGSTGKPKGVAVQHRNVSNFIAAMTAQIDFSPGKIMLSLTTISFDIFILETLVPLAQGLAVVMADEKHQKDSYLLKQLLQVQCIDMIQATPSRLKLLMQERDSAKALNGISELIVGGEAFPRDLYDKIKKEFHGKLYNVYGPTETTVWSTLKDLSTNDETLTLTIGRPILNTEIIIMAKDNNLVPRGVAGELCIGGAGVARGYLNKPELTVERFYRSNRTHRTYILYKTGDLARWSADGNIEFLGRIDTQVKIRGFRIETGEIENSLLSHEAVKDAVVMVKEDAGGDNYLCAYVVLNSSQSTSSELISELKKYLTQRLPEYMVPSSYVILEAIPVTPNGKIDRRALPGAAIITGDHYIAPQNSLQKKLVEVWSQILSIENPGIIGIDANFFQLGGHSLKATMMLSMIHEAFNVRIPMPEFFKNATISGLSEYITESEQEIYIPIEAAEKKEFYELSFHQKRLWIIRVLDETNISYHMPARLQLDHTLDEEALKKALGKISERHESLRTRFAEKNGIPYQFIEPVSAVEIPYQLMDISALGTQEREHQREKLIKEAAAAPFEMNKAPLLRVTVIKWEECRFNLLFTMHHIISDGWSMETLKKEFSQLYDGYRTGREVTLESLSIQYKDFTEYQNNRLTNPIFKESAVRFWQGKVAGGFPALKLPVDIAGDRNDNTGLAYLCRVPRDIADSIKQLADDNHTTLTMVMFSIFNILLAHISNQEDVVCSLISAGRDHLSLHRIVGYFTNSLIVKTHVDPEEDFNDLLLRVHADLMETFQYQGYPLELVMDELKMSYPDIAAAFNMLNIPGASAFEDNGYSQHQEKLQGAKFDLGVFVSEYKDGIGLQWHYKKALFEPGTIESIAQLYLDFLANLSQ